MSATFQEASLLNLISHYIHPLNGSANDYDALLDQIGDAHFVLLGEASHGTHEFYRERSHISRRLIAEKGFHAIAVEADWPDAYQVNAYLKGTGDSLSTTEALSGFQRFPSWMWRNTDVVEFLGWLREYNDHLHSSQYKVGFYGLDLYGLYASIQAVLAFLDEVDPPAAKIARERYACFEPYIGNLQEYGYVTSIGWQPGCQAQAIQQLIDLQSKKMAYTNLNNMALPEKFFNAEQNARLIRNAESYYRSMFTSKISSWNLRDAHMVQTLESLSEYIQQQGYQPKIILWAHNSHIGDARATEMGQQGELNIGQLVRQQYGNDAYLIGFSTYTGTVTAAKNWDSQPLRRQVCPALAGSYEQLFHGIGVPNFWLSLSHSPAVRNTLQDPLLERAIGVIYHPESERQSHYFKAQIAHQFDAVIHFDETRAVEPLERNIQWEKGEVPETFPSSF